MKGVVDELIVQQWVENLETLADALAGYGMANVPTSQLIGLLSSREVLRIMDDPPEKVEKLFDKAGAELNRRLPTRV